MANINEWYVIVDLPEYEGKSAEVLESVGSDYLVQLMNGIKIQVSDFNLKRKKNCTCGHSARAPFCDGTHSRLK